MKNKRIFFSLNFSLRNILLVVFLFLIALTIGYRFYEWKVISNLNQVYVNSKSGELELITESDVINQKYIDDLENFFAVDDSSAEAKISNDEFISIVKIIKGREELYISLIKDHKVKYNNLRKEAGFLIGKRRIFERNLLDTLNKYYELEIESTESNIAYDNLLIDSYTLAEDEDLLSEFANKYLENPNQTEIYNNFAELASIAKYSKPGFKFDNEESIMAYRPKGLDSLKKRAEYLSANYEVLSEFSKGNNTSVAYKLEALNQNKNDLNIDSDAVANETKEADEERAKDIAQSVVNEVDLIQKADTESLFRFPLLKKNLFWYQNQTICNLIYYKFEIYSQIKENNLDFNSLEEAYDALKEIPPSLAPIADRVNLLLISYENNDEFTRFSCPAIKQGSTYQFTYNKF